MINKLINAIGGGGPKQNPPIYVSSANDPRYKMYQDSLNLYNAYDFQKANTNYKPVINEYVQMLNNFGDPKHKTTYDELKKKREKNFGKIGETQKLRKDSVSFNNVKSIEKEFDPMSKETNDIKIFNYYKSLPFKDKVKIGAYSSPDIYHRTIKPVGEFFDGIAYSPVYKKPLQPVMIENTSVQQKSAQLVPQNPTANSAYINKSQAVPAQQVQPKPNVPLVNLIKHTIPDEKPALIQAPVPLVNLIKHTIPDEKPALIQAPVPLVNLIKHTIPDEKPALIQAPVPLVNLIKHTIPDEKPALIQAPVNQLPSTPNANGNWVKKEQLSNTSGPGGYNYYVNNQSGQTMTETQYNALQEKYNQKPVKYRTGGQQLEFTPQIKQAASSIASFLFGR